MKRLLLIGVGSALMFTMGGVGPAQADNGVHISTSATGIAARIVGVATGADRCAGCHRAHTSKGAYNLKVAQPDLCYSCHGAGSSGSSEDVVNSVGAGGAALRAGGFSKALIGTSIATKAMTYTNGNDAAGGFSTGARTIPALTTPAEAVTSSHNVDGVQSAVTGSGAGIAWGNGPNSASLGKAVTLECGSCHDPHGNRNYRILRPIPVDAATKAVKDASGATITPAIDVVPVNIPDAGLKAYTTTDYWLAGDLNVPLTTAADTLPTIVGAVTTPALLTGSVSVVAGVSQYPDKFIANIAQWCTTCHTRYLAGSGSYKTASGDATFMYRHRSDANNKESGAANCITCHVAHGSNAKMTGDAGNVDSQGAILSTGVKLPGGGEPKAGDSRLLRTDNRGMCTMCHNV